MLFAIAPHHLHHLYAHQDHSTSACLRVLDGDDGHHGPVHALAVGPDYLVSGGKDAALKVWRFADVNFER